MRILDETSAPFANGHNGVHTNGLKVLEENGLNIKVIQAPYDYLSSLPSKNVREKAIDAFNVWFQVPPEKLASIKLTTQLLHNASLMLDDLEDGSHLRRGQPSTHTIFGAGQTVNAANYQILRALQEVQRLGGAESLAIYAGQGAGKTLHRPEPGPSLDVQSDLPVYRAIPGDDRVQFVQALRSPYGGSQYHVDRPGRDGAPEQPGALLPGSGRLPEPRLPGGKLTESLPRPQYKEQKGYCEDLDEGKYSLPLIHLVRTTTADAHEAPLVRNILTQRRVRGSSSPAHKQTVLALMEQRGSLAFTAEFLAKMRTRVEGDLAALEKRTGVGNKELRGLLRMLVV
ncbi:geranylgeranyl diphosphate synthase [Apiospora marii]|uniref:Geranylgeranyl diphosphate synthase n=1 Tax=Apiospora marii TaxID=335849 RepID=A0ABR1R7J2_9PEZI